MVKIENGMGSFKEFQANVARRCKQWQVLGDDDNGVRESDAIDAGSEYIMRSLFGELERFAFDVVLR